MLKVKYVWVIVHFLSIGHSERELSTLSENINEIQNYSHTATLEILCNTKYTKFDIIWLCGSSILNQRILLTSAHCLSGCTRRSTVSILVGSSNGTQGTRVLAKNYVIHENYVPYVAMNDIALLRLSKSLPLGDNAQRIALIYNPPYNEIAQVAGWGLLDEDKDNLSDRITFINHHVWSLSKCKQKLTMLPKGAFCAVPYEKGHSSSRVTSGSALVVRGYIQIGIVSYIMPFESQEVVVYTDTGYFLTWIYKMAKWLYCVPCDTVV